MLAAIATLLLLAATVTCYYTLLLTKHYYLHCYCYYIYILLIVIVNVIVIVTVISTSLLLLRFTILLQFRHCLLPMTVIVYHRIVGHCCHAVTAFNNIYCHCHWCHCYCFTTLHYLSSLADGYPLLVYRF
jgi:hypothetical protein